MEASPAKVIHYFNGEKQNLIPLFQRPYTWNLARWETLWDDILVQYDLGESSTHFMGAIVSLPVRSVPVGVNKHLIIDGQQRLMTVSLLLCALRDCVDQKTKNRIQGIYLTNLFREPEDTLKVVPTQADRDIYCRIALKQEVPEDGGLIVEGYRFFRSKLTDGMDLNGEAVIPSRVLFTLEHALLVVMINLGNDDDPYLIFESLNFKGEPLTQADLVRNYILMQFRHSASAGGEQERIHSEYWKPLESSLRNYLAEFLRHYAMKEGENIKQGGIYAAIKARLKDLRSPDTVEPEIRSIFSFGKIYAGILDPTLERVALIRERLLNIKELEITTAHPLLLRLLDAHQKGELPEEELEKCLELIEAFVVRRAICDVPTNALNKLFLQWCKNFPHADHASWLHKSMSSGSRSRNFPTDQEFGKAFTSNPQYGRGATNFVLRRIEKSFHHKEPVDLSTVTIRAYFAKNYYTGMEVPTRH